MGPVNPQNRVRFIAIIAVLGIGIAIAGWFAFSRLRAPGVSPGGRAEAPRSDTVGEGESTSTRSETRSPDETPANVGSKIDEPAAIAILGSFVTKRDFYGVPSSCLAVRSAGFDGRRYTLEVANRCETDVAAPRFLGRWRVDSTTREVLHQREDGRYVRP